MSEAHARVPSSDSAAPSGAPSGVDRRERLATTIASLERLRQEVVVSYCRLAGVSSFQARDEERHDVDPEELRRFCQIMVDYTAMGHFEVYQRIMEGKERRQAVKDVAAEVYPAIARTTDYLVDFNDKYDGFDGSGDEVGMLERDLSKLGEVIGERGELEDRILAALKR